MIELKKIVKTYKSKKSKNTTALNGVSINFEETGITFLLGKSGSGKSTLLNIIGGLDKYDAGDMLILGKSSKNFTQADFDSYRNTYIGFIFQEFNILEDYDVYENIVLALQLQQKEIKEQEIDQLLDKLELTELKKRKVNELSGGQKQRVAIARALIKNPKIILADEPIGNLDSKTGTQVMELLKEIAKKKLVIIVSHDEEYAEKYGDRIIEIKDGEIIRDTKEIKTNKEQPNNYQTIKSKLPLKDSFKLGIGSLKHKKIKLCFTILLTIITLGFFSCTDTLSSYDANVEHAKILADEKEQFIQIENYYLYKEDGFFNEILLSLNENNIKEIKDRVNKTGYKVYQFNGDYNNHAEDILYIQRKENMISSNTPAEIVTTDDITKIIKENILGRNPQRENEIVISNSLADSMINNGVEVHENVVVNEFKESKIFEPNSYEDILNTEYTFHFGEKGKVKIVGIIIYEGNSLNKKNITDKIYVTNDFIEKVETKNTEELKNYLKADLSIENVTPYSDYPRAYTAILDHEIEYYNGSEWIKTNQLKDNEVVLHISQLVDPGQYEQSLNNYINRQGNYNFDYESLEKRFLANYIKEANVLGKKANLKVLYDTYGAEEIFKEYNNLTVVGVYNRDTEGYNNNYFSTTLLNEVRKKPFENTSILFPMTTRKEFEETIKKFKDGETLMVKSSYSSAVNAEKVFFKGLKKVAFYAGVVFLVFAIFLITNFMITSISYRKKEIGVLRALGARSLDVAKIFLWEGFVMALISGIIASILLVLVTNWMNAFIMKELNCITTPFLVGIRQFMVIFNLVYSVTIIASIIPIKKISKMKPIDAILNK